MKKLYDDLKMELSINNNGEALLKGILSDAEKEAAEIISTVEKSVSQRRDAINKQVENILKDSEKQADIQEKAIIAKMKSATDVEIRRNNLHIRDRIIKHIINEADKYISNMMKKKDYSEILSGWIVEAALGLQAEKIEINSSAAELKFINQSLLSKTSANVLELSGQKTEFIKSTENPLQTTGVVLKIKDKQISYDNKIVSRFQRYQSEIRKIIINALFTEQGGAS